MTEGDLIESLGPLLYAVTKSLMTYKSAYSEAVAAYKNLTGNEAASESDVISKLFSAGMDEVEKTSETSAEDFLKKYQQIGIVISMFKKLMG